MDIKIYISDNFIKEHNTWFMYLWLQVIKEAIFLLACYVCLKTTVSYFFNIT